MTAYKAMVSWMTLPVVVVKMTNLHLKLFVSLVKRGVKQLYLPSPPKFVMTVLLGAFAIVALEKGVVL